MNEESLDKADPSNYRPISLTCVFCKVLEHIVAWFKHIYFVLTIIQAYKHIY